MFNALVLEAGEGAPVAAIRPVDEAELPDGSVTVAVSHSTVNYKDGLAVVNGKPVVRAFPMIPGVDFAGEVAASTHEGIAVGDRVVLNGFGVGEGHWGGFSQRARVPGEWLVTLPASISAAQAMAIGTAGYTAMLCVMALERHGVKPGDGDVLVTGAAGGVGSTAVALLSGLGHRVVASTGRTSEQAYLEGLGAAEIMDRSGLSEPSKRPMGAERFAAVVDSVGSHTLVNALGATRYGGVVAACGLAHLPGTVYPFILRGVTLAGVDSVNAPLELRRQAWDRLAADLDPAKLDAMTVTVGLADVPAVCADILQGKVRGRVVVDVNA
jgi:acrylyl-CoA reductase (NADPH)